MTKAKELATYHTAELVGRLNESRQALVSLRFRAATGQLDNVSEIKKVKQEIARILTILHEDELGIEHLKPVSLKTRKLKVSTIEELEVDEEPDQDSSDEIDVEIKSKIDHSEEDAIEVNSSVEDEEATEADEDE